MLDGCLNGCLEWLFMVLWCGSIDISLYAIMDGVTKVILNDAKSEERKKLMWLYEVIILGFLSVILYWSHHMPYILAFLTSCTFVSTQFFERVCLAEWWMSLNLWWEEHKQMKNSMYDSQNMSNRPQYIQQAPLVTFQRNNAAPWMSNMGNAHVNHIPNTTTQNYAIPNLNYQRGLISRSQPLWQHYSTVRPSIAQDRAQYNNYLSQYTSNNINNHSKTKDANAENGNKNSRDRDDSSLHQVSPSHSSVNKNDRRPQPRNQLNHNARRAMETAPSTSWPLFGSIIDRVVSSLGANNNSDKFTPPGLQNKGHNMCFVNSVLQCLAHTPTLLRKLDAELCKDNDCSMAESSLITTLTALLRSLNSGASRGRLYEELMDFRGAASAFTRSGSPVFACHQHQEQQDAAEMVLWLLSKLDDIFNKSTRDNRRARGSTPFTSENLQELERIYGELTPTRVSELVALCRRDINRANALDASSYDIASRSLADLEWLTHKRNNSSIIDNMFNGQLVEAFHCLSDNHISVKTDPFMILSIPIERPHTMSGLVRLEDCFLKYCRIETLIGVDGWQCSMCNNDGQGRQQTPRHIPPQTHLDSNSRNRFNSTTMDSAVNLSGPDGGSFSPIASGGETALSDSGYYDNRYRTSTPITDQSRRTPARPHLKLRDANRRCFLRQLPEYLIIQLGRFLHSGRGDIVHKNHAPVQIPLNDLCLDSVIYDAHVINQRKQPETYLYDLYAVCIHYGAESTSSGHYFCYVQVKKDVWYRFDDELVTAVTNIEYELCTREVRENCYLLFYRRI